MQNFGNTYFSHFPHHSKTERSINAEGKDEMSFQDLAGWIVLLQGELFNVLPPAND